MQKQHCLPAPALRVAPSTVLKSPVFCALDVESVEAALTLAGAIAPYVGGLKLGLEFFNAAGPDAVARVIGETGLPLFLDLKLHDIPNTVAGGVRAIARLKPALLTVHTQGGAAMMRAARDAAPPETKVVGVTVLTSLNGDDLHSIGVNDSPQAQVTRLARLAHASGLDGIVCSAHEVAQAAAHWPGGTFVVPGIRPAGSDLGDQKRVMTPRQALDAGATVLVIGRPITAAPNPAATAAAIAAELA
jgi:orotidine-5'-phosphate decarboxylase